MFLDTGFVHAPAFWNSLDRQSKAIMKRAGWRFFSSGPPVLATRVDDPDGGGRAYPQTELAGLSRIVQDVSDSES